MSYIEHLQKDRKISKIIVQQEPISLKHRNKIYLHLCASIISQQLSNKVADIIYARFLNLYGGAEPTAEQITSTPFDQLRGTGLSNAKANYVLNVARFATEKGMEKKKLDRMGNDEVIEYLTQIKGVGRWTVEMLLMFTLGREDVFAIDDYGIQSAMIKIYKLDTNDKKELKNKLLRISGKWSPYRTYACMHLWKWKDGK
jgi:DNA-3-methyladenine glycosylase II